MVWVLQVLPLLTVAVRLLLTLVKPLPVVAISITSPPAWLPLPL